MRARSLILGAAAIVGSTAGFVAVYAAVQHNPQEMFVRSGGAVDYTALGLIFCSWFLPVSMVAAVVFALIGWAVRGLRLRSA
jgi:hypothetical protein